jgi:hypothetical protein
MPQRRQGPVITARRVMHRTSNPDVALAPYDVVSIIYLALIS